MDLSRSRAKRIVVAVAAFVLLAIAAAVASFGPGRRPRVTGVGSSQVARGVMERSGKVAEERSGFIDSLVVPVAWAELEPADQSFTGSGWSVIDSAIADPRGFKLRLRIHAGRDTPGWVKRLAGPPASGDGVDCSDGGLAVVLENNPQNAGCVPSFWTDAYLDQYEQLMREIAARYEARPAVAEVVNSACTTIFAEPFIRAGGHPSSNARLFGAGLNEVTDRACLVRSVEQHMAIFSRIRTSLATHLSWQIVTDPAIESDGMTTSWPLERRLLASFRADHGARLVLQNNGLGADDRCPDDRSPDASMWCYLGRISPPKGFQTETWAKLGSPAGLYAAVENALSMGACFVELPRGATDPENRLPEYDRRLEANCSAEDVAASPPAQPPQPANPPRLTRSMGQGRASRV